jgi:adenylate cyclase
VLNNILQGDYLHEVSSVVWMPLYALFLFALANLMLRVGIAPMIPVGLTAIVLLADAAFATLWFGNALMPVLIPEVGVLVLAGAVPTRRFFTAEREKDRIRDVLRTSLSDKVMNKMLEHPDNVKLGGEKQQITIMFCDIRNFTRYCDERDPQEVMDALNEYMEEMTQVVFRHDGTVDKYIGDCIMAFWNAPQPQADHAALAVSCALEMRGALARFEEKWAGPNRESFECGIGVHTGEALVGNMGSSQKRTYTAMGSTVNLASRLEALTKQLGEPILISQGVAEQLGDEFPLTDRGWIRIVGVARPVHVYAVISEADLPPAQENGYHTAFQVETGEREGRQPLWRLAPLPDDVEAEEQAEY